MKRTYIFIMFGIIGIIELAIMFGIAFIMTKNVVIGLILQALLFFTLGGMAVASKKIQKYIDDK